MKKLVATILTVLTCGAAYALPIGNPSEASLFLNGLCWDTPCCDPCDPCFSWCDAWSIRLGFYGDYVFNRHLEVDDNGDDDFADTRGADIDETSLFTNAGYIALNICDRVDIFSTLGASKLHIRTDASSFGLIGADSLESELFFETRFSWSVGARATLWECDCFVLGIEGQYFRTTPNADSFLNYDTGAITYFDTEEINRHVKFHEWQVGVGISYRFATSCPTLALVPYAGVKWSWAKLTFNKDFTFVDDVGEPLTLQHFKAKKLWGYAVGMTFTLCDMIGVNVEGRWGDEKAVSVLAQFRF